MTQVDLCTRLRVENEELQKKCQAQGAKGQAFDALNTQHTHLQKAHTTQAAYIQRLQKEQQKIEAYQTTITMQETVISKMEDLIAKKLDKLRGSAKHGVDQAVLVAKDQRIQALQSQVEGNDHARLLAAKDQRIQALEGQLVENATSASAEISQLKLRLFELEMNSS